MTEPRPLIWARSGRFVPRTFVRPLIKFINLEASSGIVLVAATAVALIWANVHFESYEEFFAIPFLIELGPFHLEETLRGLINDGLMAIFFFVVGLEIKRELVVGDLRDTRAALLPALAALGGMAVPALIYLAIAGAEPGAERGWGIPMATDIAFAIGVLALLGRRIPAGVKLFLLTLAIVDDIGAIAVIAIFYTSDLSWPWLGVAVAALISVWVASRSGIRSLGLYLPLAFIAWLATLESGVHATLAGVALGLLTPAYPYYRLADFRTQAQRLLASLSKEDDDVIERESADHSLLTISVFAKEAVAPLARLEPGFNLWSANLVVPIFALANAGISIGTGTLASPIALGVALGLLLGKTVGVSLFTAVGLRTGIGRLPPGMGSHHILGVSILAGIGFTVSIFVAGLAFSEAQQLVDAKIGIFAASVVAAVVGWTVLRIGSASKK
ncbi:MAG TPA: Na+/H+ antiporter NhaA [Acidimicrobiia bacterium]|nr:Na+/H+ antiporter NhaA [Acidimicrobiia bacterium]